MASRAEGRVFKFRPSPLSFSKVMCEITFEIYHEFNGKGKSRGTLRSLRSYSMACVKFIIRTNKCTQANLSLSGISTYIHTHQIYIPIYHESRNF